MIKTIKYALLDETLRSDGETSYSEYGALIGNLSYQKAPMCDGCFCADTCPDNPVLRRIIRWVRIIAQSKHGMTVLFSVAPLIIGLILGVFLGRKLEQQKTAKVNQTELESCGSSLTSHIHRIIMQSSIIWSSALEVFYFVITAQWLSPRTKIDFEKPSCQKERDNNCTAYFSLSEEVRNRRRQSGVALELVPKHIAVIMDGNRRYGKAKYASASRGHVDGGYKLQDMVHWCIEECIRELTVYAFSTENWNRSQGEIDALMNVFCQQCEELRKESVKLQIIVRILSTQTAPIPDHVKAKLKQLEDETRHCQGSLILNVCLSYGSRGEIVAACRSLAVDCCDGKMAIDDITEANLESRLLTKRSPPPDILLRTSGEVRLSNFLLWQCAYSEFFFLSKHWPDLDKKDLLEIIRTFATGRQRRFGT